MTGGALDAAALVLPLAMGVGLSPFPLIGAVVVLSGPRAASAGPAFAAGWLAGLSALTAVALLLFDGAGAAAGPLAGVLRLGLGFGLLALAVAKVRGRRRKAAEPPGWMAALESADPARALAIGAALGGLNPKNVGFAAAAAGSIAALGITGRAAAGPALAFVLLGSVPVLVATGARLALGQRAAGPLGALRWFLVENGALIVAVVFAVLGVKLVGEGFAGLLG